MVMRVRFAPSPTGHLHVGNARTALFNWLLARGQGGTSSSASRTPTSSGPRRESEAEILEDLRWMGLDWDEGVEAGGYAGALSAVGALRSLPHAHRDRSFGRDTPTAASARPRSWRPSARRNWRRGSRRATPAPAAASTRRTARRRQAAGEPAVVRLRVPANRDVVFQDLVRGTVTFHTDQIGDPVLVRSDGIPAYNYAVVIDDQLMAVTHVIRGEDHISNTPRQVLVYEAFGWTPPALRAPLAGPGTRPRAAVETPRRHLGRGVPCQGLSA